VAVQVVEQLELEPKSWVLEFGWLLLMCCSGEQFP
jgi:hypothetical protein